MPSSALLDAPPLRLVEDIPAHLHGRNLTSLHLWIVVASYQVDPLHPAMDPTKLISIEGPGCYFCGQPYSPELASRPCPG